MTILIIIFLLFAAACMVKFCSELITLIVGTAVKLAGKPFDAGKFSERTFHILSIIAIATPVVAGLGFGLYCLFREYGANALLIIGGVLAAGAAGFGLSYWVRWVWKK